MFSKVLIASDGSEGAARALDAAIELAARHGAALHMVCVEETQWVPGTREEVIGESELAERRFEAVIAAAKARAATRHIALEAHLLVGHPVRAIAEFVREGGFDALVLGYVGHSRLYGMLIGGTAERLVRLAPCTVIVIKG